jgi:Plasmid pRiA4b ORF-3-like protein
MTEASVARLKITLDDVRPAVLRRLEVPLALRLDRLHVVLQAALGWSNYHLYEFRGAGDLGWGIPDPDGSGSDFLDASKGSLADALASAGRTKLAYLYDFGDGWEHTIKLERLIEPVPDVLYPRLIEAAGRCPPEDVGGPWGYAEFLEAINDPKHERHAELRQWIGGRFDPADVQEDVLAEEVAALAKRWSRKPRGKRARRE